MNESLPRRDAVLDLLASRSRPLTAREMAARLRVSEAAYGGFTRFLESLAQEGALRSLDRERYAIETAPERRPQGPAREGVLQLDPSGFGVLRSDDARHDVLLPEGALNGALHGDRVQVRATRRGARGVEGEVARIIERGEHRIGGTLRRRGASAWLEPDEAHVRGPVVLRGEVSGAEGDAAVARLTRFPEFPDENPEGTLVAALGPAGQLQPEIAKILAREGASDVFSPEALREAQAAGPEVAAETLAGREDLTGLPMLTLAPGHVLDRDAAFWVERGGDGGYTAWVAAADVTPFVTATVDAAARERGGAIQLPDRVIPMLPPALSGGHGAFAPGEARLCLCVVARLGPGGEVLGVRLVEGFLRSRARLSFGGVARALGWTQRAAPQKAAEELADGLRVADQLAQLLRAARLQRGAIGLDPPEPRVHLHRRTGAPSAIERWAEDPGERRAAHIAEELSHLANEAAAGFLVARGVLAIFRVQPPPDEHLIERWLALFDDPASPPERASAEALVRLSRRLPRHPRATALRGLLRQMTEHSGHDITNIGHFGLAAEAYVDFCSPGRRYPALLAHRILRRTLEAERLGVTLEQAVDEEQQLARDARAATEHERRAKDVERQVIALYRAVHMRERVGESFEGTVVGVTDRGIVVALDEPFVEAFVRADALGKDTYEPDEERTRFVGRRSGDAVSVGDRITVTVEEVSLPRRQIHAFRHAPDMADQGPLRHSPFHAPPAAPLGRPPGGRPAKKGGKKQATPGKTRRLGEHVLRRRVDA